MKILKKLLENFKLPNPKGYEKIFKTENSYIAWESTTKKETQNIQMIVMKRMVEDFSEKYIGRDIVVDGILIIDIYKVDYQLPAYVVLSGKNLDGKDKQARFQLNDRYKGHIFKVDEFSQFFDENYKNKILKFVGCRTDSDQMEQITRKIVDMGFYRENQPCVRSDKGQLYKFSYTHPFIIMDDKLGEIDPHFEEIWD